MVMYNISYKTGGEIKQIAVVARCITHALDMVDLANKNNFLYQGIVDCNFVQRIETLLIEEI